MSLGHQTAMLVVAVTAFAADRGILKPNRTGGYMVLRYTPSPILYPWRSLLPAPITRSATRLFRQYPNLSRGRDKIAGQAAHGWSIDLPVCAAKRW
eukprot:5417192-Pleurochrysis_carterae.AAC.1